LAREGAEHQAGAFQMNEGGRVIEGAFVVFDKASASGPLGKAALKDSAAWLDGKTFGGLRAAHDFHGQFGVRTQLFDPKDEFAGVTRVGPDLGEPAKMKFGPVAILHAGGGDLHAQQPAGRGGLQVAFSPFDLLVDVVAARSALARSLNALAVEDGYGRGFFPALGRARSRSRSPIHCQHPSVLPFGKGQSLWAISLRSIPTSLPWSSAGSILRCAKILDHEIKE
jgi:hypothetical protein